MTVYRNRFRPRMPRAVLVRSAERHWFVWNTYPGVLIGAAVGLPKRDNRPGYPMLSILWGRPVVRRVRP